MKVISRFSEGGIWLSEKVIFEDSTFGGFKSWRYNAQSYTATLYFVDAESHDTIIIGKKTFDRGGRLLEDVGLSNLYRDSTINYLYTDTSLDKKEIISDKVHEIWNYKYRDGLLDSILIFDLLADKNKLRRVQKIIQSERENYIIESKDFGSKSDSSRILYGKYGQKLKDLTQYNTFYHTFFWPDTNLSKYAHRIDTLSSKDTLKVRYFYENGSAEYHVVHDPKGKISYFGQFFPNTPFGTVTFVKSKGDGLIKEESQYRLNSKSDTIWVGCNVLRYDRLGKLKNRLVYKGKKKIENLLRDEVITYTDTSVISTINYSLEGVKYKNTVERPGLHDIRKLHEKKERWDPIEERWVLYFEESRKFDEHENIVEFKDLYKEIYREYDEFNRCISEETISLTGELPKSWQVVFEHW